MAKVVAPLLGFSASGSIAKTVVFGRWRGIQYGRQHVIPANPQSTAQSLTRDTFATLREIYKRMEADARAPWEAYARGRPFTSINAFVGENLRVLRGEADMNNLMGSPGANGGFAYSTLVVAAGAATGQIKGTLTAPTLPTGWTIVEGVAMAVGQQAPEAIFEGKIGVGTDTSTPYEVTIGGFSASEAVVLTAWFVYTKPDGTLAYSTSLTDDGTAAA